MSSNTLKIGSAAAIAIVMFAAMDAFAQETHRDMPQWAEGRCTARACLFIECDDKLAKEATLLAETLDLRLCKRGVKVLIDKPFPSLPEEEEIAREEAAHEEAAHEEAAHEEQRTECTAEPSSEPGKVWWIAHLRSTSEKGILLGVDHLGAQSDDDLIREVPLGPDSDATAWTLALMIEDAISPYLKKNQELIPIGAGLAIIEPPAVGGVKKRDQKNGVSYPVIRSVGVGLTTYYLGAVNDAMNDFLLGPSIGVQGLLGPRFVASFSAAWVGTGKFSNKNAEVKGKVSHIPLNLAFGFIIAEHKHVDLLIYSGVSAGFTIFQTSSPLLKRQRSDIFFDPWFNTHIDLIIHVYGPLAIYLEGGVSFPIIKDVLENSNTKVYYQDRVMPLIGIGIQLCI